MGLEGKTAFVTGGTRGIGLMTALALQGEGCKVAVCSRHLSDEAEAWWNRECPDILWIGCDVRVPEDRAHAICQVRERFGWPDILVNNVGGGGRWGSSIPHETRKRDWQDVMGVNYGAARSFTMAVLPGMLDRHWGRVVTVASIYGREKGGRPWFTAAKAAQVALMAEMARYPLYARNGITFNSVAPGPVMIPDTGWDRMRKERPQEYATYCDTTPMGRLGKPEEVADLIVFLCSERASWINGACMAIDGGQGATF